MRLPQMASWLEDYLHELACFPTGAHDDQVDATSQALLRWLWARGKPVRVEPELDEARREAKACQERIETAFPRLRRRAEPGPFISY